MFGAGCGSGGFSGGRDGWPCAMFYVSGFTCRVKQSVFYQEFQYRSAGLIDASGGNFLFDLRCFEAA